MLRPPLAPPYEGGEGNSGCDSQDKFGGERNREHTSKQWPRKGAGEAGDERDERQYRQSQAEGECGSLGVPIRQRQAYRAQDEMSGPPGAGKYDPGNDKQVEPLRKVSPAGMDRFRPQ